MLIQLASGLKLASHNHAHHFWNRFLEMQPRNNEDSFSGRNILYLPHYGKQKTISNSFRKPDGFLLPRHFMMGRIDPTVNSFLHRQYGPDFRSALGLSRTTVYSSLAGVPWMNRQGMLGGESPFRPSALFPSLTSLLIPMHALEKGKWFLHKTFM